MVLKRVYYYLQYTFRERNGARKNIFKLFFRTRLVEIGYIYKNGGFRNIFSNEIIFYNNVVQI